MLNPSTPQFLTVNEVYWRYLTFFWKRKNVTKSVQVAASTKHGAPNDSYSAVSSFKLHLGTLVLEYSEM
jgi:hypothetical protein